MIIGNPSVFAIESSISQAYERLSFRALGFFVIYVGGRYYGRRSPDSTMLACSYDEIERRIAGRGRRTALFATEEGGRVADAFRSAFYDEKPEEGYFGIPLADFVEMIHSKQIMWPGGDEAFDDGSYVLQFDIGDRVRLIAFKSMEDGYLHDPGTRSEVSLAAEDFYRVLQDWRDAFLAEWVSMPKVSEADETCQ